MRGGAHFAPSFAQYIDELSLGVIGVGGGEIGDLVFQKNEARGVLEGLRAGVGFQAGLGNPYGNLAGLGGGNAGGKEQGAGALGLAHVKGAAPSQVAGLIHGEIRARGGPALEVLATRGETEEGRGGRIEADYPRLHAVGVNELGRTSVGGAAGVAGMGGVDGPAGEVKGGVTHGAGGGLAFGAAQEKEVGEVVFLKLVPIGVLNLLQAGVGVDGGAVLAGGVVAGLLGGKIAVGKAGNEFVPEDIVRIVALDFAQTLVVDEFFGRSEQAVAGDGHEVGGAERGGEVEEFLLQIFVAGEVGVLLFGGAGAGDDARTEVNQFEQAGVFLGGKQDLHGLEMHRPVAVVQGLKVRDGAGRHS